MKLFERIAWFFSGKESPEFEAERAAWRESQKKIAEQEQRIRDLQEAWLRKQLKL